MKKLVCVIVAVVVVAIAGIGSVTADTSSFTDPTNDLIYIYTGDPVPPASYVDYVDVVSSAVNKTGSSLEIFVVTNSSGLPSLSDSTFWTVLLDEDDDPVDNCPDYPTADVDTMYSIIYDSAEEKWGLERATYEIWGWDVKPSTATWGMTSTWPDGELIVHLSIPLTELDELGDVLPWKVMTETDFIGDLAPDSGLIYLGDPSPEPWIYHPNNGSWIATGTGIGAIEVNDAGDIVSTSFEYSVDGAAWHDISIDYDGRANTWPHDVYNASLDGWGAMWNTTGMPEGWYHIRATMTDNRSQTGQSQIMVYVDPTPPTPTIVQPAFDRVVSGTFQITATTGDEDISGVVFSIFKLDTFWYAGVEKNVPHTPQGYGCAPAAAAASLLWLDNYTNASGIKIFDDLVPPDLEEPENLTEKMHEMFKTRDNILTGQHLTNDTDVVAGLERYVQERKNRSMKEEFVVKTVGRQKTATYDTLPQNTTWVEFYKTMLPHEDILLLLGGTEKNGSDWGHVVTANSFRPTLEIWWTPEGCIWAQVPPYKIDFMDHNDDTGYREVEMDENGSITGLEKYYTELAEENQTIYSMIVVSPKTAYEDLWEALLENKSTPADWTPIGKGVPYLGFQEFLFDWNTSSIADGSYLLMATAIDAEGNEASEILWITVDNSAPNTTKTIGEPEYGEGYYLTSDTVVGLSADDGDGSGVDSLYYRIWNNGTWSNWTWIYCGPVIVESVSDSNDSLVGGCTTNFTLPGNCTHYIEYYAVDLVGNNETLQNQTHVVDNEAPITLKDVGEPSYPMNTTAVGEHWIVTNGTFLFLTGADDCCKIDDIYLKNNGSKTYFIRVKHKDGFKDTIIRPGERKKITPAREYKKLTITISERSGGKSTLIMKEDLNCSVLKFLAALMKYEKVGDRYTYNDSVGPSSFGINDLLLEEFTVKECKGSELKCWSGTNATMYREWFDGEWREWGEYTGPFTLEGGGIHYLEYYSVDNLGNLEVTNNETFFVTDAVLEPFFVTPTSSSLVYGNVTLWAGEATGRNVSYATFWYSDDGVNWTYIGIDNDGSEPTVGGELVNASDWGDGWRVYWNASDIEEGVYSIKVDIYGLEGIGTAQIAVYVDPTPPVPRIHEPPFDEDVVHGSVPLSVNASDENVSWVRWEYANKTEYYEKGVDEKIQFNYCRNISGKNLSAVCCGPTAAASCLNYWAEHGYPNITRNGTINQSELVASLARLMKTDENGTSASNCKKGIENYLQECGYGCSNPHGLTVEIESDENKLNFTRFRNELEANREDVLWLYRWNYNATSRKWQNGHWVVAQSVNNSRSGNVSHNVDIMCPTYGNVSNVSMYDNGTLYRPDVGGWRYPSAMVTVSEKGSIEDPDWVEIANVTDPAGGWAALWDTLEVANGYYFIRVTMVDETGNEGKDIRVVKVENAPPALFDTGSGSYPSIAGRHNGTLKPTRDINVSQMYTYPCVGAGGHTEYVRIWNTSGWNVTATWGGYYGAWQTISFDTPFMLHANETYYYSIKTGSYPQIIHEPSWNATGGIITCTSFEDVNGRLYEDWIPAIRLE